MKVKKINAVVLITLILTSCTPAVTVASPTETVMPRPTFTSIPPTATITPTSMPETAIPTSEPIVSVPLSADGPWLVYRQNDLSIGGREMGPTLEEFVLLNQDGSGHTLITLYGVNTFLMESDSSANQMVEIGGDIYVFRPSQARGCIYAVKYGISVAILFLVVMKKVVCSPVSTRHRMMSLLN